MIKRKVKIEINTREHFHVQPKIMQPFRVESNWFTGKAAVSTYAIEELLATKLRALYQRKKGRDLYDFWYVYTQMKSINIEKIIEIFQHYMRSENIKISKAEFEKNILEKKKDLVFNKDIHALLSTEQSKIYSLEKSYDLILDAFLAHLPGDSWKGVQ